MSERISAGTLAAFLEGKLEPGERAQVLRILAEHPDEYEGFADAAYAAGALDTSGHRKIEVEVLPLDSTKRRGRLWLVAVPALIAAGIGTAVVLPRLNEETGVLPHDLASRLSLVSSPGPGSLAARLGATWDQPGWSVTRGSSSESPAPAQAFRLGARATDVEIAMHARDTIALQGVGADLLALVSRLDGGAGTAAQYRGIVASGGTATIRDRREAATSLRDLVAESAWFDLGAWAEAARVAAAAGNRQFLGEQAPVLDALFARIVERSEGESATALAVLRELQMELRSLEAAERTEAVKDLLRRLMAEAGG